MPENALQLDPPRQRTGCPYAACPRRCCVVLADGSCTVTEPIPVKHKMALIDLAPGDVVRIYGMVVGEAVVPIPRGGLISTRTIRHRAGDYTATAPACCVPSPRPLHGPGAPSWAITALTARWARATTGSCCRSSSARTATSSACARLSKKNSATARANTYRSHVRQLVKRQPAVTTPQRRDAAARSANASSPTSTASAFLPMRAAAAARARTAQALCGLLAGYIHHPNVAGATVLSLGCQNAQASMLLDEFAPATPN